MAEGINDRDQLAEEVLAEHARISEHLTDDQMRDIVVTRQAQYYAPADGWRVAPPDDPAMRRHLIEDDARDADFADAVLGKMREIDARRPPGWDRTR